MTADHVHAHAQDTVIREAVIMKRQQHPHILELLAVFVDGSDLWMIIPLVPGGSLESLLKRGYQKVHQCHPVILSGRYLWLSASDLIQTLPRHFT